MSGNLKSLDGSVSHKSHAYAQAYRRDDMLAGACWMSGLLRRTSSQIEDSTKSMREAAEIAIVGNNVGVLSI